MNRLLRERLKEPTCRRWVLATELRRFARQHFDRGVIASRQQMRGRQPRTTHANHVRQREKLGRVGQADATGRAEGDLRQRAGPGADKLAAAGRYGGKELLETITALEQVHRLAGGGGAWQQR